MNFSIEVKISQFAVITGMPKLEDVRFCRAGGYGEALLAHFVNK